MRRSCQFSTYRVKNLSYHCTFDKILIDPRDSFDVDFRERGIHSLLTISSWKEEASKLGKFGEISWNYGAGKQGTRGRNRRAVSVWWIVKREGRGEGRLAWDIPLAWYPIIKSEQRICHICQARSSSTLVPSSFAVSLFTISLSPPPCTFLLRVGTLEKIARNPAG